MNGSERCRDRANKPETERTQRKSGAKREPKKKSSAFYIFTVKCFLCDFNYQQILESYVSTIEIRSTVENESAMGKC